jgi:hypothetical protein
LGDLPPDLTPYVPLFCSLLPKIGAAGQSYLAMAERIAAVTGGVQANAGVLSDPFSLDRFQMAVEIRSKALMRNQGRMFDILADLCRAPDFTDLKRLHTVINQLKTSLENSIPASGHNYAARAAAASLSAGSRLREEWGGLHLVRAVKEIAALKPEQLADLSEHLQRLARLLFGKSRLRCAVTAEKARFAEIGRELQSFLEGFPAGQPVGSAEPSVLSPAPRAAGWVAPVPVSYVARVFRTVPLVHSDAAGLMVLAKLLRAGYLHREVREKGGAYGGMANFDAQNGLFSMLSYRDPQLLRTLEVYRDAAQWAASGGFSESDIREAILAVFASLDRPLSPGSKGHREFDYQLQGLSRDLRRLFRERVLAADRDCLTALAKQYLLEGRADSAAAVVSGEEMLQQANRELGGEPFTLEKY